MQIRKMTIDDYEKVYDLWLKTPGMGLNNLDDSKDGIKRYLLRNPGTCFVAIKEDVITGVILSGHDGRRGYIYHIAVTSSERRKGIGTALVERAVDALKSEGINKVALVVFSDNVNGNSFWKRCGFTEREDLIYRNKAVKEIERIDI